MSIYLPNNPYRGVNAHLHSKFQNPGDSPSMWPAFHASHIAHLADTLNTVLPDTYRATTEQSLQIQTGPESVRPRPDVLVYDRVGRPEGIERVTASATATLALTLEQALYEPEDVHAILIYYQPDLRAHDDLGQPVARFELLSPSNKDVGAHRGAYINNRYLALKAGLVLVEIDYLHESPSPVRGVPPYPQGEGSFPYSIILSDPYLPPGAKSVLVHGFGMDEQIPTLDIPLVGADSVRLEFGAVYQYTFRAGRWGQTVDYQQEPRHIESYHADDQRQIRERMAIIQSEVN